MHYTWTPRGLHVDSTWTPRGTVTLQTCFTNSAGRIGLALVFCHMGDCVDTAALLLGLCLGEVASFCALQTKVLGRRFGDFLIASLVHCLEFRDHTMIIRLIFGMFHFWGCFIFGDIRRIPALLMYKHTTFEFALQPLPRACSRRSPGTFFPELHCRPMWMLVCNKKHPSFFDSSSSMDFNRHPCQADAYYSNFYPFGFTWLAHSSLLSFQAISRVGQREVRDITFTSYVYVIVCVYILYIYIYTYNACIYIYICIVV